MPRSISARRIALRVVNALLHDGYTVTVADGHKVLLEFSTDADEIIAVMFTTTEDWLIAHKLGQPPSWVRIVGDSIRQYTPNLDPLIASIWHPPVPNGLDED